MVLGNMRNMTPTITKEQKTTIHVLLGKMGRGDDKEYKESLVSDFTDRRETSTTQMQWSEAEAMIEALRRVTVDPHEEDIKTMRRKMFYYMHNMSWYVPGSNKKLDYDRLDNWCLTYGKVKKKLTQYEYLELVDILTQFELVYRSFLKDLRK